MKYTAILLLLFCLSWSGNTLTAQIDLSDRRLPQQLLGGTLVGFGGAAAGGVAGRLLVGKDETGWEALGAVVAGTFIGYTIGNGYGVYRFGNTASHEGRLGITWLGSATGLVAGVMIGANLGEALIPVTALTVMAGSMIGYNMTRSATISVLGSVSPNMNTVSIIRTPRPPVSLHVSLLTVAF